MDALPHPPVCENNEVYLSNEGQCKQPDSDKEKLRYTYYQEQHSAKSAVLLNSPNDLTTPVSQDWTFSVWVNPITLRRNFNFDTRIEILGLQDIAAVEFRIASTL